MNPATFRTPDEEAMVRAAFERASAAYGQLQAVATQAMQSNPERIARGLAPIALGQVSPPQAPPHVSAAEQVRMLDGQAQWYAQETARYQASLAAAHRPTASAGEPEATLAAGPRAVPPTLAFAELMRGPWVWLRWLLFPPFAMGVGVACGGLAVGSPLAAGGLLAALVGALWVYGFVDGLARIRLLASGEVATVLQRNEQYGNTRNKNVPMLSARGWDVSVEWYTGMSRRTDLVVQTTRGVIGKVSVSHGPAFHGVVLVDPDTGRGRANLDLGSVPRPGRDGQWRASLPARVWITSLLTLAVTAALVWGAVALATMSPRGAS